ncbi:right-handed parallel beta-helix repeat-containing protein [Chryseosolibacter indicus]|uniref:Right-handed parallel beta-helix repeat-containing protein n=1 Tax=Chryseosolibacter indicus TaxID=2782351 RepID=A0ABS5VSA3_9BACT|nr:right-handed parallel beta-helix repeat-containing protein [Chryseosolibacter indicus]MBT1703672.1 right-handed parallel beta-helix repeat-containing protein [Chryseosolibacter indicus]
MSAILVCITFLFSQCNDEEVLPQDEINDPTISATATNDCGCTYTVPVSTKTSTVDGKTLGIKPGNVICLKGGATYGNIVFKNIRGTASAPVVIKNCGGTVTINGTGTYFGIKTQLSSFFRITGGTGTTYGIKVNGGHHSVTLEYLTTNVEFDHVEVANSGFSGIMAKTDPSCDDATIRGNFVMKDVRLHDNYVHDTQGEGFYVGHTFWSKGVNTSCGVRYPHPIEGLKIYNNVVRNSGWEAIQVGSTPSGSEVYNNKIYNYGVKNELYQNHGVQFSEAGIGKFYGNFIKGGKGNAVMIIGNPQNFVHDNVIINAGEDGIFCEDRSIGAGFHFVNNTIINPGGNGIRIYADEVKMNYVYNNLIVNPGAYAKNGEKAFIFLLSKAVPVKMLNNYQTRDISSLKFASPSSDNFALTSSSPVVNKGTSISTLNIPVDYIQKPRLKGTAYDIGAYELQ